jgi:hypothetical protein
MAENHEPEREAAPRAKRRPLNVRWMAVGALVLVAGITLAQSLLETHVIEKDEVLSRAYHAKDAKLDRGGELTDEEKSDLRGVLLGSTALLSGLAAMLLVLPLAVGVIVGRFTGSVRDTAITVAVGMAGGFAYARTGVLAIVIVALIYLGIGALAGLVGRRLAARARAAAENPLNPCYFGTLCASGIDRKRRA